MHDMGKKVIPVHGAWDTSQGNDDRSNNRRGLLIDWPRHHERRSTSQLACMSLKESAFRRIWVMYYGIYTTRQQIYLSCCCMSARLELRLLKWNLACASLFHLPRFLASSPSLTHRLTCLLAARDYTLSQPTLSQLQSLKIRRSTFPDYIQLVDRRLLRLLNCERVGRVLLLCVWCVRARWFHSPQLTGQNTHARLVVESTLTT